MRSRGRRVGFGFLPLLFGGLAALGQAPFGWWGASLAGLTGGLLLILFASGAKQAALRGWLLALGYFLAALNWLVDPFFVDAAHDAWMAPFALFFMAGGLALFWAVAAGVSARFFAPTWRWLALAALLSGAELLRGRLFTGFPWASPGHVWIDTPLAALAALIGAQGLAALSFLWAAALARLVLSARPKTAKTAHWKTHTALLLALTLAIFAGAWGAAPGAQPPDRPQIVRLVQPNAPQHLKWDPDHAWKFVERQLEFTAADGQLGRRPDLILWPETAVPTLLRWTGDLLPQIAQAAGAPVLLGVQRDEGLRYFNSLVLLGAGGKIRATYDKHHLVPFGEYIPFGDVLAQYGVNAFAAQLGNGYSAGAAAQVLDLGALGTVAPLICYEAVFPRDLRAVPTRPDWVLHATNDAWFGNFSGPQQHLVQARFRAIEFGLPVLRVANTGVSAVIDAAGRVRQSIALNTAGFLDVHIPGARPATPYARFGDLPLTLFVIATLCVLLMVRRRSLKDE